MRARSLALAALIIAAPAPALATSTPPSGAESSPVASVDEAGPPADSTAPATPSPAPETDPATSAPPAEPPKQIAPPASPAPEQPQPPQDANPVVSDPWEQQPAPATGEDRWSGVQVPVTPWETPAPAAGGNAPSAAPLAGSAAAPVTTQSSGIQPITGTLLPASSTAALAPKSSITGVHHYAAKGRAPLGTVTVKAAPKLGTLTVVPAQQATPAALWGLGVSAVAILAAAFWAHRRTADS